MFNEISFQIINIYIIIGQVKTWLQNNCDISYPKRWYESDVD